MQTRYTSAQLFIDSNTPSSIAAMMSHPSWNRNKENISVRYSIRYFCTVYRNFWFGVQHESQSSTDCSDETLLYCTMRKKTVGRKLSTGMTCRWSKPRKLVRFMGGKTLRFRMNCDKVLNSRRCEVFSAGESELAQAAVYEDFQLVSASCPRVMLTLLFEVFVRTPCSPIDRPQVGHLDAACSCIRPIWSRSFIPLRKR